MNLGLAGKVAVVTGAARGLGKEIALGLASEGASVAATDIDLEQVEVVVNKIKKIGNDALAVRADVGEESELDDLVQRVIEKFGRIDILVNNAGICPRTTLEDITVEEWDNECTGGQSEERVFAEPKNIYAYAAAEVRQDYQHRFRRRKGRWRTGRGALLGVKGRGYKPHQDLCASWRGFRCQRQRRLSRGHRHGDDHQHPSWKDRKI